MDAPYINHESSRKAFETRARFPFHFFVCPLSYINHESSRKAFETPMNLCSWGSPSTYITHESIRKAFETHRLTCPARERVFTISITNLAERHLRPVVGKDDFTTPEGIISITNLAERHLRLLTLPSYRYEGKGVIISITNLAERHLRLPLSVRPPTATKA